MATFWFALMFFLPAAISKTAENYEETCLGERHNSITDAHRILMTVVAPSYGCQYHVESSHNVNLYQVMMVGSHNFQDHFSFNYTDFPPHGRMVECINGICNQDPYYWMIYNGTSNQLLEKGVDETYPGTDNSLVWKYMDTRELSDSLDNANAPYLVNGNEIKEEVPATASACIKRHSGPSHSHITVILSAVNDRDPSWPPVCNLPAFADFGSTLGEVLADAQRQHPKKFVYTSDEDETHGTYVNSINDLDNEDEWNWLVYDPDTLELLPTGLDDTFPYNDAAYLWRYTNETHDSPTRDREGIRMLQRVLNTGLTGWTIMTDFFTIFTNIVDDLF